MYLKKYKTFKKKKLTVRLLSFNGSDCSLLKAFSSVVSLFPRNVNAGFESDIESFSRFKKCQQRFLK